MARKKTKPSSHRVEVNVQQSVNPDDVRKVALTISQKKLKRNTKERITEQIKALKQQHPPRQMKYLFNPELRKGDPERQMNLKGKKKRKSKLLRVVTEQDGDVEGAERGVKPLPPSFEQGPYETEGQFLRRLNRVASRAVAETQIEQRFKLDFCPRVQPTILSTKTGQAVPVRIKVKTGKGKAKFITQEQQLVNKRRKRRERDSRRRGKDKRKRKQEDREDGYSRFQDVVEFGEVVLQPPSFSKNRVRF